jgi:hypothetical protein
MDAFGAKENSMNTSQISEALKENANDFISRSINAYNDSDYKAALINLWSGILLILKYWIFNKHPSMIYSKWEKVIKYDQGKLSFCPFVSDGSYQTVDYNEIKDRFKFLGNENSLLFNYDKVLDDIRKKRNRIEHFVHDISENEITSVFVKVLPFINDFIDQELHEKVNDFLDCWDDFLRINEVYQHRLRKMEEYIHSIKPSQRDIQHGSPDIIEVDCTNCENGKLVNVGETELPGRGKLYCKACEYETEYIECNNCSRIILEEDFDSFLEETGICSDCFDDICRRND